MKLRVFNIIKKTKVEGPKIRYCIWVQGCSRHCKGCQAKHTWSHKSGILYDCDDIINDIKKQKNIEGVTFLGGEPFEQAEALGYIAEQCKKLNLGIVCFTGDLLENLQLYDKNSTLLKNIDLLIDGEFMVDKLDYSRPWCGSSNQRYHFLTNRYDESIFNEYKNKIELNISKSGMIFMNGMGNFKKIQQQLDFANVSM